MISRIYITQQKKDNRGKIYQKSWLGMGIKKVSNVQILESYLIQHNLSSSELEKIAESLTNPILEKFSIDTIPINNFNYLVEIGYKPGVTDNVAHTVKEMISDLLHLPEKENESVSVFSSKIFAISGSLTEKNVSEISSSLYNPLIETAYIFNKNSFKKNKNLPAKVPQVVLTNLPQVMKVPILNTPNEELIKIGKEGIKDGDRRRGPLALDLESMKAIKTYFTKLKREPNDIELESLAQTWSEHCKHTIFANEIDDIKDGLYKTYIKGATNKIRKEKGSKDFCVSVFSDNAGGVIFDDDFLITHKVETHNSPSALDPFGGAITGIVGVNRDTIGFGLGAKPVANTYGFCFGNREDKRKFFRDKDCKQETLLPKRIMEGVVKGINVGGNCSGIPTISGFIKFDDRYRAKPMVFAGTIGLIPKQIHGKLSHEKSAEPGDYIVVVGGRVGADGIHGATFSSVAIDSSSPATAVQIGDPITQKKFSDAIVKEARGMNLYNSITDNGAGGISCSVAEMAKECNGARVFLEKVPLKYPGLQPWEIWISESQERMTLAVPKKKWEVFNNLMKSRGVEASIIGEFTNSGKCIVSYDEKVIMDIDLEFLHNGLPKRHLTTKPYNHTFLSPVLPSGNSRTKILEELLAVGSVTGFSFISEQYDHEVQASSVLKPISGPGRINTEAQVFRPVLNSNKGAVVSSSLYPSYSDIHTYHMASSALDTAVRNIVSTGGKMSHLAILDNFCWCSSNDEVRLAELVDALQACYDGAVAYGTPFISGKDSMFNDFQGYDEKGKNVKISIPPTLLISAISVIPDLYKTISPEFKKADDVIYLLGETNDELGASEYFKLLAKKQNTNAIGSIVPKVDFKRNLRTYKTLENLIEEDLVASSMSLSSGGLALALSKACVGGGLGCNVSIDNLPGNSKNVDNKLFSESQGRILISVSPKNVKKVEKIISDISYVKLGTVSKNNKVVVTDTKNKIIDTRVQKLFNIYHAFSNEMK